MFQFRMLTPRRDILVKKLDAVLKCYQWYISGYTLAPRQRKRWEMFWYVKKCNSPTGADLFKNNYLAEM